MVTGVNHTSFTVSDMERSVAFYRDVLGMTVISDREVDTPFAETVSGIPGARFRVVYLEAGGDRLELIKYYSPPGKPLNSRTCDTGSAHLAFFVPDLKKAYQELKAKGVSFRSEPLRVGGGPNKDRLTVYFTDPDGIALELIGTPRLTD